MSGREGVGSGRIAATVVMTLAVQALTAMALSVPSVLAPVAAPDLGFDPTRVGIWVGMAFVSAMFAGVICGSLVGRYGPVRMFQAAALCVACGYAAGAASQGLLVFLCAVLVGVAHGLVNPASSTILAVAAPPHMRTLVFSIKQTGVPVGAAIAGMLVPAMLLWTDWRHAILVLGVASAGFIVLVAPFRSTYDRDRRPEQRLRLRNILAPVAEVRANRPILALAVTSGVYSGAQTGLVTYLISYLNIELGYSLVAAGFVFAAVQFAGVAGRLLWGWVSDRLFPPRLVLSGLGMVMALCGLVCIFFSPAWPPALVLAICIVYGATAVGWNGIYLAEIARLAPPGRIAVLTGGTQFYTFAGGLIGPPVFGTVAAISGSYGYGFILNAILPLLMAIALLAPAAGAEKKAA